MGKPPEEEVVEHRTVQGEVFRLHTRKMDFDDGDLLHRLDRFNFFVKRSIPIADIDLTEFDLDVEKVDDYKRAYLATGKCPPVVFDSISGSMIDGMHRAAALAQLGLTDLPAYVGTAAHADKLWSPSFGDEDDDSEDEAISPKRASMRP